MCHAVSRAVVFHLLLASTLLAGDLPSSPVINKDTVFTFFRSFKRLTKWPHVVAPLTGLLCRAPTPEEVVSEKLLAGSHYKTSIHIYVNKPANEAVARKSAVFPIGAVIVKEKLGDLGLVTGVGGMIKHDAGYDPENGDWEYFYADKASTFATGRMRNCAECHAKAKARDFVFSVWNLERQVTAP